MLAGKQKISAVFFTLATWLRRLTGEAAVTPSHLLLSPQPQAAATQHHLLLIHSYTYSGVFSLLIGLQRHKDKHLDGGVLHSGTAVKL